MEKWQTGDIAAFEDFFVNTREPSLIMLISSRGTAKTLKIFYRRYLPRSGSPAILMTRLRGN